MLQDNFDFVVECNPAYSPVQVNFSCLNNLQTKNVINDRLILLNPFKCNVSCFVGHLLDNLISILHSDKMIVQEHAIRWSEKEPWLVRLI